MPQRVLLNQEAYDKAEASQHKIVEVQKRVSYVELDCPGSYYYGYLGEWALDAWLTEHGISHVWPNKDPLATNYKEDFIFYGCTWDVKCAAKEKHHQIQTPTEKFYHPSNHRDYYVGVKLFKGYIYLFGYISRAAYSMVPISFPPREDGLPSVPTLCAELRDLIPVENLLDKK